MPEIIRDRILSLCEEAETTEDSVELSEIIERIKETIVEAD